MFPAAVTDSRSGTEAAIARLRIRLSSKRVPQHQVLQEDLLPLMRAADAAQENALSSGTAQTTFVLADYIALRALRRSSGLWDESHLFVANKTEAASCLTIRWLLFTLELKARLLINLSVWIIEDTPEFSTEAWDMGWSKTLPPHAFPEWDALFGEGGGRKRKRRLSLALTCAPAATKLAGGHLKTVASTLDVLDMMTYILHAETWDEGFVSRLLDILYDRIAILMTLPMDVQSHPTPSYRIERNDGMFIPNSAWAWDAYVLVQDCERLMQARVWVKKHAIDVHEDVDSHAVCNRAQKGIVDWLADKVVTLGGDNLACDFSDYHLKCCVLPHEKSWYNRAFGIPGRDPIKVVGAARGEPSVRALHKAVGTLVNALIKWDDDESSDDDILEPVQVLDTSDLTVLQKRQLELERCTSRLSVLLSTSPQLFESLFRCVFAASNPMTFKFDDHVVLDALNGFTDIAKAIDTNEEYPDVGIYPRLLKLPHSWVVLFPKRERRRAVLCRRCTDAVFVWLEWLRHHKCVLFHPQNKESVDFSSLVDSLLSISPHSLAFVPPKVLPQK